MPNESIVQTTIWGEEIVLTPQIDQIRSASIKPRFLPAPLFDAKDALAGLPSELRKAFLRAQKQHAKDRPRAKPLTVIAFLRDKARPSPRRPTGRPSQRPHHVKDTARWNAYIHAKAQATKNDAHANFPDFDTWLSTTSQRRERAMRGLTNANRSIRQNVVWRVVVPRVAMIKDPAIEREWNRKLMFDPVLAKTHRMALRGVMMRVA